MLGGFNLGPFVERLEKVEKLSIENEHKIMQLAADIEKLAKLLEEVAAIIKENAETLIEQD